MVVSKSKYISKKDNDSYQNFKTKIGYNKNTMNQGLALEVMLSGESVLFIKSINRLSRIS